MQQQAPLPAYGITKVEYARMVREMEARQAYRPGEGLFARLRKRFS
ncbi:hypothetical protein [Kordiimonas aestuarii]|nr:hypothetical protein [Kordiimonas aestuarii]